MDSVCELGFIPRFVRWNHSLVRIGVAAAVEARKVRCEDEQEEHCAHTRVRVSSCYHCTERGEWSGFGGIGCCKECESTKHKGVRIRVGCRLVCVIDLKYRYRPPYLVLACCGWPRHVAKSGSCRNATAARGVGLPIELVRRPVGMGAGDCGASTVLRFIWERRSCLSSCLSSWSRKWGVKTAEKRFWASFSPVLCSRSSKNGG